MMQEPKQTPRAAHTRTNQPESAPAAAETAPAAPESAPGAADPGAEITAADIERSVQALADRLAAPEEPADDLFDAGLADGIRGLLPDRHADNAIRRQDGPGRPRGAKNRRNQDVADYLRSIGIRDPLVTLATIQSLNVGDLMAMGMKAKEAFDAITSAADKLAPYWYAKRSPDPADLPADVRPVMFIGEMTATQINIDQFMSAGITPDQIKQLQALSARLPVRRDERAPDDDGQVIEDKEETSVVTPD